MLKQHVLAGALALALALGCSVPALAISAIPSHAVTIQYATRIVPSFGVGEYDGTMRLTLNPDGIINGFYIPDSGGPRLVTGGIDGDHIWLDIGFMGGLHITGQFKDGHRIVGYTFIRDGDFSFVADVRPR